MANFTRERTDADWHRGLKVPHLVIRNIDEKTKKAVSGSGGTYNLSGATIDIGGAGIELQSALRLSGGAVAIPSGSKVFRFGDDDYFKHGVAQSRSIQVSPLQLIAGDQVPRTWYIQDLTNVGVNPAPTFRRARAIGRFPVPIPDGAILTTLTIVFAVSQSHANVPQLMPAARVIRIDANGDITKLPLSVDSNEDPDGWRAVERPASGAAWYNSGNDQSFTRGYSGAGEPADSSRYGYFLEWREEAGSSSAPGTRISRFSMTVLQRDLRPY